MASMRPLDEPETTVSILTITLATTLTITLQQR